MITLFRAINQTIMIVTNQLIQRLILNEFSKTLRFTQDSPIYPDVWTDYFEHINSIDTYRLDLILTPHRQSSSADLFKILSEGLQSFGSSPSEWRMASNGETIVAKLTFEELIRVALPLTNWWQNYLWKNNKHTADYKWLIELVGAFYYAADPKMLNKRQSEERMFEIFKEKYKAHIGMEGRSDKHQVPLLWSVSRNRRASITIEKSIPATKADASRKLFDIDGAGIAWAVLDTGIDARHPAFKKIDPKTSKPFTDPLGSKSDPLSNHTRIVATYDFTRFRDILAEIHDDHKKLIGNKDLIKVTSDSNDKSLDETEMVDFMRETERDLKNGRMLDWTIISPLFRIPHNKREYKEPEHSHGTHVAGIIGAGLQKEFATKAMIGMCPGIGLYDIRVLDADGQGDEFNILAAIQFLRWLNSQKDGIIVHGANMSFSMIHEVASYGCGQTPVCNACERLVSDGIVVVAAAGNLGQAMYQDKNGLLSQGFRIVNITDPGNSEEVITVGATHRDRPHSYGVSYFSSKGPTGDGRVKPDLVAPGEKIVSLAKDEGIERMDGTSMAAPHVSGAAALLLAKHKELIGQPRRVKDILCKTATDLGREKYFQGCGMLDVLRAIQSV
jgi:subtilisin family serine protease